MHDVVFFNLRDAIIMQAVLDYCESKDALSHPHEHNVATVRKAKWLLDDVDEFFNSQWYVDLMRGAPYDIYSKLLRGDEVCLDTVESAITQTTLKSSETTRTQ